MESPDLDRMYESFVRIGSRDYVAAYGYLDVLRTRIAPGIVDLRSAGLIDWYCLLVHGYHEGVPTVQSDDDFFWHIRVSLADGESADDLQRRMPAGWEWTRQMARTNTDRIGGVTTSALRSNDIRLAWRTIGEQSEWVLRMLDCYSTGYPPRELAGEIVQYLHLFTSMTQLLPPISNEQLLAMCRARGLLK